MEEKSYRLSINEGEAVYQFDLDELNRQDIVSEGNGVFHVLYHNKSFRVRVLATDYENKIFKLKIHGTIYTVQIDDQYDLLVEKLGLQKAATPQVKYVKAPMPGMVLQVAVGNGQSVSKGDHLLILEAMKMENIIKSPGDGVIKEVMVEKGKAVEKGALLIEME